MLAYYFFMALFGTLNLIIFVTYQNKRSNSNIAILFYLTFASNWGYLALATSNNIEEALLANKVCYLGGCFALPSVFFAILHLCNYTIPKLLRFLLFVLNVVMFGCVLSTGYLPLYYKETSLGNFNGASVILKEYGPMHTVYYVILCAYMLVGLGFAIYTLIKKSNISFRNMLMLVLMECFGILAFLLGKVFLKGIEVMPVVYVMCELVFIYVTRRLNMYDIESTVTNSLDNQHTYGYVTFDLNKNYLGSNAVASNFFPELHSLKIDFPIKNKEIPIFTKFSQWLNELDSEELVQSYEVGDTYYRCTLKHLYYDKKKCGYLIEIIDNTNRQKYVNLLNQYNAELTKTVDEKTAHIRAMQDKILFTMGNMVENRDTSTGGHIYRTSYVVGLLTDAIRESGQFQLSDSYYDAIVKFAPMHDLGKIAIDDSILRKPGRLTDEEFNIIKTHSEKGANIVGNILDGVEDAQLVEIACNIARYHHEKWDGSGYPCHLAGEDIPFEARIMAIADVYDALVSKRCYKEKMSYEEAYNIIKDSMGKHFDPQLFVYFDKCRHRLEEYYNTQDA